MRNKLLCGLSLIVLSWINLDSVAQPQIALSGDQDWREVAEKQRRPIELRAEAPDTLSISSSQPFFDDFSYPGPLPDSNRWFIAENNLDAPYVNRSRAVNPPSQGVATFDGINRFNAPYNPDGLSNGLCDRLITHYLDLSPFQANSNLKLSFAFQPQGRGNAPEAIDSFFVYYYLPELNRQDKVYSAGGRSLRSFKQIILPIDKVEYFQTRFQLIFESRGSQNGKLDEWHLDYVYLAPGRANNDTVFNDLAPVELVGNPLDPYTAVPMAHFDPARSWMRPFSVRMANLSSQNKASVLSATLSDPVGGNSFVGLFEQDKGAQLPSFLQKEINFGAFSNQYFDQPGQIQLEISVPNIDDEVNQNNRLTESFGIDSVFAYDDGESDLGFGLNKAWGFGNRYVIRKPDSVVAIWISFVPTVNYNPITTLTTYMEQKTFRLTIWDEAQPDSILAQQVAGAKVNYGSQADHFQRYVLSAPVEVSDTFWVGVVQTTSQGIGVGLDKKYPGEGLIWWDSAGVWTLYQGGGVLMIRPEMKSRESFGPAALDSDRSPLPPLSLYPNPLRGRTLIIKNDGPPITHYQARLFSMEGKQLAGFQFPLLPGENEIILPSNLPKGLYFWQHIDADLSTSRIEKVWLLNPH